MFPVLQAALDVILGTAWHQAHGKMGARTFAGDPTGQIVPDFVGQFCVDTTGAHLYWASSAVAAGWKKLNN